MITAGLDIGSVAAKGVLLAGDKRWQVIVPTGWSPRQAGAAIIASCCSKPGCKAKRI